MSAACCERMATHLSHRCREHPNPFDCPDNVVSRADDGSYGLIIHDGGGSVYGIDFCPWCAAPLNQEQG